MTQGIVLEIADHAALPAAEVDAWYRDTRLPQRAAVAGVLTAERFVNVDDANVSVAVYDLRDVDVLASTAWGAAGAAQAARIGAASPSLMNFHGRQTLPGDATSPRGAGGLLVNGMSAAPEGEAEFNRWYDEEHIPALSAVPGCILARRFVAINGCPQKYLALYHLESPDVVRTEAWAKAVETPWTLKIRPFMRDRLRIVCRAA
jgi:hypothetical protein